MVGTGLDSAGAAEDSAGAGTDAASDEVSAGAAADVLAALVPKIEAGVVTGDSDIDGTGLTEELL